jgi:hypothetical protein
MADQPTEFEIPSRFRLFVERYRKLIVAAVGAGVVVVGQLVGVDSDIYTSVVALATALGVYAVPNRI